MPTILSRFQCVLLKQEYSGKIVDTIVTDVIHGS